MDEELFRKTEGRLYRYYKQLRIIKKLKSRSVLLYQQILEIQQDMKDTNVKIDYIQPGVVLGERVQTSSSGISFAESQIMHSIESLEIEAKNKKKKMLKIRAKIRELTENNQDMQENINMLSEENKRFLEYKYDEKLNPNEIAEKMNMASATAYRKRSELVENIAQWCNIVK
ncbi:hypothetical protein [Rhodopseudomonas parapalustris]